jgi:hypothetical protein
MGDDADGGRRGLRPRLAPGLLQVLEDHYRLRDAAALVLIADFDFMGERARIDDLALTLHFALSDLAHADLSAETLRRLSGLVTRYD